MLRAENAKAKLKTIVTLVEGTVFCASRTPTIVTPLVRLGLLELHYSISCILIRSHPIFHRKTESQANERGGSGQRLKTQFSKPFPLLFFFCGVDTLLIVLFVLRLKP